MSPTDYSPGFWRHFGAAYEQLQGVFRREKEGVYQHRPSSFIQDVSILLDYMQTLITDEKRKQSKGAQHHG